jgi:DNA modification methylase/endonuclease YncB( thermonuclease family)
MAEVADESIHLVVTSPPYWQLKDYGPTEQVGYHETYEDYINSLNLVWKGCQRVLHKGCRLCVNIGDQFARAAYYGRYKVIPIRTEITRFCETVGFDYMGAIIWQKVTTCNTSGGATIMGSFPYPRNGVVKLDYEFILIFKKPGRGPAVSSEAKKASRLSREEWNEYFYGHWSFSGERQNRHLAAFPEQLPRRLIRMYSFVGETVLDPFLGSGTTSVAALSSGRNSVGYEINGSYEPLIRERLLESVGMSGQDGRVEVLMQKDPPADISRLIQELPYVFKDSVTFARRVDPKKRSYGSRIDDTERSERVYHRVSRVVSPSEVMLETGDVIRLIGIRTDKAKRAQAARFLEKMARGQKIYLKRDELLREDRQHACRYVYLKNHTFVNAHLIRSGLVEVDTESDYEAKQRLVGLRSRAARER